MADLFAVTGTINSGATPINVNVTILLGPIVVGAKTLGPGAVTVTMTTNYARSIPPGFPFAPFLTGSLRPGYPQILADGTTYQMLACEAAALILAGAVVLPGGDSGPILMLDLDMTLRTIPLVA